MKRILSVFLTAVVLLLGLCSCSKPVTVYGEYLTEYDEKTDSMAYIKLLDKGRASFSYDRINDHSYRGEYVYDKKNKTVTIDFTKYDGILVFEFTGDKLIFNAEASVDVEEINGVPRIADGQEFIQTASYLY